MRGETAAWQLFERDPAGYEAWYDSARGQRADRAERALLGRLLAPFASPRSALEVGCGTGHFTRWLADRVPVTVGVDRSPAMLAEARRRHPDLPLVLGDALHLPVQRHGVDLTIFVITLEFVEDPAQALVEAVRVARQGVLVVALNRWSAGGYSRRWGHDAHRSRLGHARDFSLASLRELASVAAGPRLRAFRWASALFPDGLARTPSRVPLGDVIGIAAELAP